MRACRDAARSTVAPAQTTAVWDAVRTTIAEPVLPAPLRLLRRLGVPTHDLVVVSAADSLLVPWAAAVGFALLSACLVGLAGTEPGQPGRGVPRARPAGAGAGGRPGLRRPRPAARGLPRHAVQQAAGSPCCAPRPRWPSRSRRRWPSAWSCRACRTSPSSGSLPSLGLTTGVLVLLTWLAAPAAGAIVAGTWVGLVVVLRYGWDVLVLTSAPAQLACVGLAAARGRPVAHAHLHPPPAGRPAVTADGDARRSLEDVRRHHRRPPDLGRAAARRRRAPRPQRRRQDHAAPAAVDLAAAQRRPDRGRRARRHRVARQPGRGPAPDRLLPAGGRVPARHDGGVVPGLPRGAQGVEGHRGAEPRRYAGCWTWSTSATAAR